MDLLQIIISFLNNLNSNSDLSPLFDLFKNNSFDLKKILSNLSLESVAPIIKEFLHNFNQEKNPTGCSVGQEFKLEPIAFIADKDVVYTLNRYFNS